MIGGKSFNIIRYIFRQISIIWYLLLSPLFIIYLSLHVSGLKQRLITGYQYGFNLISLIFFSATTDSSTLKKLTAVDKQALDVMAGSGWLPLTVFCGLFYVPFYLYTMVYWNTQAFLWCNIPLMFLFGLVCCDDTHYDSHEWLVKRNQSVWYRRLISGRFKQYTQMVWFPLTQHLPHLHIHHKFNMKNEKDVDYVGCYPRNTLKGFFDFVSIYEWNYMWVSFQYFNSLPGSKILLWHFSKDVILHYGLLVFAAYCGWEKFLFQYISHCMAYYFIGWITFYVEHPFHHTVNNSYEHFWNVLTIVDSKTGLCTESHTSHHNWAARTMAENAAWANDPVTFATSQLENRHLALKSSCTFEELVYIPYLMMSKQYATLAQMLHFKTSDQLKLGGMKTDLIDAYGRFQMQCDAAEMKRRLEPR